MSKNYYEILGVPKNASKDEIKKAYHRKMKDKHPDLHPDDKSLVEETKEANEAYEILGNEEKRKQYDLTGETPTQTATSVYPNEYQSQASQIIDDLIDDLTKRFSENSPFGSSTPKISQKDFDDFMEYITNMDEKFKEFGLTSDKIRKTIESKRDTLTQQDITGYKNSIENQLETLIKNAIYYDDFVDLFEKVKTEVNTWNPPFIEEEFKTYLDKKNRGNKTQDFFALANQQLNELNAAALIIKNQEINDIRKELEKRKIGGLLLTYMQSRHINLSSNLTKSDLNYLKEFILLYDKTVALLSSMKINIHDMLYKMHKNIEKLTLEELKVICKCAEEMNQKDMLAKWKLSNLVKSEFEQMGSPKM